MCTFLLCHSGLLKLKGTERVHVVHVHCIFTVSTPVMRPRFQPAGTCIGLSALNCSGLLLLVRGRLQGGNCAPCQLV